MEAQTRSLWRGVRPFLGTSIGVGIFGLPYVFSQAGFGIGLLELLVVGTLNIAALCLYADLILVRKRHAHFVSVIGFELGFVGRVLAAGAFFLTLWGAMIAYMIVGASFIGLLADVAPSVGLSLVFAAVASMLVAGGLPLLLRLHAIVVPAFFGMVGVLFLLALPHIQLDHFTTMSPEHAAVPLGVIMFAVGGLSAIPEVRDALGKRERLLPAVL
ncbi:MAG: amino acid transporter, partial [Candidatus Uhrbacteria bacterium]|nr:amino acid transporter [Candidatus Uhrbacteria bacterium]